MQASQTNKPTILNTDKALVALSESEMPYALNHDILTVPGKATPMPANYLGCDIEMPLGDNYSIGSGYYSNLTNETYFFVANTNNAHFIYRINGDGTCQIVNHSPCLQSVFGTVLEGVFNPKHTFEQWRVYLRVDKLCANRHGKALIFTNGLGEIGCLDVEASIATNSFATVFFDVCDVDCETVQLCVPKPLGCATGEFVALPANQRGITNKIIDVGIKVIYQHVYYDLRASEWSDVSNLYYQDSKSCFSNTDGLPRCINFKIPLGNPLVDKIRIAFSTDNGVNWLLADTIEKYESYSSAKQYWYQRSLSTDITLTGDNCSFVYSFCNDKQCQPLDPADVTRVFNPVPRQAQGFIQIKELLGFYNFIAGTCPLKRSEIDKIAVTLNCTEAEDCLSEYVSVKVRAIIHNFYDNRNAPVYRKGGVAGSGLDDIADPAYFGTPSESNYRTKFGDKKRNFTAYIEGTDNFVEMKQWTASLGFVGNEEDGIENQYVKIIDSAKYWYQEAEFRVKKGTKGFIRLMSHESITNTTDTSTFIRGTLNNVSNYYFTSNVNGLGFTNYETEIYFDASLADVSLTKAFIIDDVVKNASLFEHSAAVFFGYLKLEDGTPIEFADLFYSGEKWMETDYNGFFYRSFDDIIINPPFEVRVERNCLAFSSIKTVTLTGGYGGAEQTNITLLNTETVGYKDGYQIEPAITVVDCNGNPISGVTIAISGSKAKVTGADGIARFELRNKSSRNRSLRAVLMDKKGCFIFDCVGNCNPAMPSEIKATAACYFNNPPVTFANMQINIAQATLSTKGLKKGGRYGFGIVAEGKCGRISATYELKNGYINVPKLQENGLSDYCSLAYNANGVVLPAWVDVLKIVRTENQNPFELQWVVDKIEKVNGKLRLTIQSLNDYNASYLFKSNTVYKYLKGDRIEFIKNGDGSIFSVSIHGLLNYTTLSPFNSSNSKEADYFNQLLIEDDGRLDNLVPGAIIELQREKECTTDPAYFSICASLQVVNGLVSTQIGAFSTFDTYRVKRSIGSFYQQSFEHHSPSDFWGERITDVGRAYFTNKYENEKRFGRSQILNFANQFNRFDSRLIKIYDAPEQGDITGMNIKDGQVIMAIGEHDTFLAQVSDTLLRMGQDGLVRAAQPDQIISDAQPKLSGQFGCKYPTIGSIYFGDGFTTFFDIDKSAYVKHNYNVAEDVSEGKTKNYFKVKASLIQSVNAGSADYLLHYRFATGINKHTNVLHITIKTLKQVGINNSTDFFQLGNETMTYQPMMNEFLSPVSFTPESYSVINLSTQNGCAFLCIQKGLPYITPIVANKWNEFFGIACDWICGFVVNKYAEKVKRPLAMEVQDANKLWYVKKVTTEEKGWLSEIPVSRVSRDKENVKMAFLGDKNGRGGLFGDHKPRGVVTKVLLIRDNTLNLAYNVQDVNKMTAYSELGLVLTKFFAVEQSGYTNIK